MSLGPSLIKLLSQKLEPSAMIERKFKGYDLMIKTDEEGNAILLFMGKKTESGTINGHRFARRLVKNADGIIIKDHWDDKGKTY